MAEQRHRLMMFGPEQRHVREHEQGIHRRGRCFGWKYVLIAEPNKWLLREWRAEVLAHSLDNAARGASKAWISLVPRLSQCGRGRLAKQHPCTMRRLHVVALTGEFEQVVGIIVLSQKTEQHATRASQRRRIAIPTALEQPTDGVDRTDSFEVFGAR